jgi:membrane fusion protein, multidrug efflux system
MSLTGALRQKTYLGIAGAGIALAVVVIMWPALKSRSSAQPQMQPAIAVSVDTAVRRDVPQFLTAVGNVQSLSNVLLRPQIDGVLSKVLVHEGQRVEHDQVLALIDDRALAAAVAQARAERSRNDANLKIAELNLKRDVNLLAEEAVSGQTVDEQRALVEQLKATVQSNEAAIQAAEIQRSYARIASPVTGKVGMRRVDPGNLVHANDVNGLFSVVQIDPISVVFSLPQQDLPRLQPLLNDPKQALVIAFDHDAGTRLATGQLMTLDNQIDSTTGTIQLRAAFSNAENRLWPGQFVTVQLQTGIDSGATVVSARAVQHGLDGTFVFRVRNGKADVVPVTVRYEQGTVAAIGAGLQRGDVVVAEGQEQLTDGMAVTIVAEERSNGPAPTDAEAARRP